MFFYFKILNILQYPFFFFFYSYYIYINNERFKMFLMQGDCLEKLKELKSDSVDLVLCDPPYGTVKGLTLDGWEEGKVDWDEVLDFEKMFNELNRVMKVNATLILFCQEPFTSNIINNRHRNIHFMYKLIWLKNLHANPLGAKKAPLNYFEEMVCFVKKYDEGRLNPLRQYSKKVEEYIGIKRKEIDKILGHTGAQHFIGWENLQYTLCTEKTYNQMINVWGIDKMEGFLSYEELQNKYKEFAPNKVFNLNGATFKKNVLEYKKESKTVHPTQKPVALLEDLIKTYSNEGQVVLDFTMGSGSTGIACQNTKRDFIGIELSDHYFNIAKKRLEDNEKKLKEKS